MHSYNLHLIRHGLTQGNLESRYIGGGTDSDLCSEGIDRLFGLKMRFEYPKVQKVYSSPMKRAVHTAEILYPDNEIFTVEGMRECNFGEFEGKTFSDLADNEHFIKWMDSKSGYIPLGGESGAEFANRCMLSLDDIFMDMMKNNIHDAALITHGGVISLLMTMTAFPRRDISMWNTDSGCGFTVSTSTQLWTRDRAVEAVQILPVGYDFKGV